MHVAQLTTLRERENLLDLGKYHERIRYNQRFMELNNQIREFTTIVKDFADQITSTSSNAERNASLLVKGIWYS